MKKLSRILAVVSAAAMMLSLAACGSNGGSAANSGSTQSSASQTGDGQKYTIGICPAGAAPRPGQGHSGL